MTQLPVRTYTPESPLAHPAKLWREMKQDLWARRELAWRLAVCDNSQDQHPLKRPSLFPSDLGEAGRST